MKIYCCGCEKEVESILTSGKEIYPHRSDLQSLPFWKCDKCQNFVGCHHKTKNRTQPLGCIPTVEIRNARKSIHAVLDPIWKNGLMTRKSVYSELSKKLGYSYHTANIKTLDQVKLILDEIFKIKESITSNK